MVASRSETSSRHMSVRLASWEQRTSRRETTSVLEMASLNRTIWGEQRGPQELLVKPVITGKFKTFLISSSGKRESKETL